MIEHKRMRTKFILAAMCGLLLASDSNGQEHFTGIGVVLGVTNHAITIIKVLPNTPASKAGVSAGLIVQKIDGIVARDGHLKDCVDMLRGAVGTKVKLELVDTTQGKTNAVELTREEIKL